MVSSVTPLASALGMVAGVRLGVVAARLAWRLAHAVTVHGPRQRLARLHEVVVAWQLANGDEVAILNRRVADAHASMAAAEQLARWSGLQLSVPPAPVPAGPHRGVAPDRPGAMSAGSLGRVDEGPRRDEP